MDEATPTQNSLRERLFADLRLEVGESGDPFQNGAPNHGKAREMARLIARDSPEAPMGKICAALLSNDLSLSLREAERVSGLSSDEWQAFMFSEGDKEPLYYDPVSQSIKLGLLSDD